MLLSALAAWALAREVTGDPIASRRWPASSTRSCRGGSPAAARAVPVGRVPRAVCCSSSCGISTAGGGGTLVLFGVCLRLERALQRPLRAVLGVPRRCDAGPVRRSAAPRSGRRRWKGALVGDAARGPGRSFPSPCRTAKPAGSMGCAATLGRSLTYSGALDVFPLGRRRGTGSTACDRGVARRGGRLLSRACWRWRSRPRPWCNCSVRARRASRDGGRPSPRRGGGWRALWTPSILVLAGVWIWSLARAGLRVGPLHLGDPGRILVFLTLAVAARLAARVSAVGASRGSGRLRAARAAGAGARSLLLAIGAVGIVVAFGAHTPYYRFLFQSFGASFRAIRAPVAGDRALPPRARRCSPRGASRCSCGDARSGGASLDRRAPSWCSCSSTARSRSTLEPTPAAPPPVYAWLASLELPGAVVEWPLRTRLRLRLRLPPDGALEADRERLLRLLPADLHGPRGAAEAETDPGRRVGDDGRARRVRARLPRARGGRFPRRGLRGRARARARGGAARARSELSARRRASTSCSCSPATAWPEQARRGAAAPDETRRLYAAAVTDLRRNVAAAGAPVRRHPSSRRKAQEVAPGFWVRAGRSTTRGSPRSASRRSSGPSGLAMVGGGVAGTSPTRSPAIRTPARAAASDSRCPSCPTGPHTLRVTSRRPGRRE